MIKSDHCRKTTDYTVLQTRYQIRKLAMLTFLRDSLERKISAVNASIETLRSQISRKENDQLD